VYYLASFMVWREAVSWRWSHVRHHSDTIIVGRDPEIAFPRPLKARPVLKELVGLSSNPGETVKILRNAVERFTADELDYLPQSERPKAVRTARVYLVIWTLTIAACVGWRTVEPLMFVIGPSFYGKWMVLMYGSTQHAGLAEDALDHRLNTRTVRMNRIHRYLYWNMNFHIEHHMFPTVPFHALPALHEAVKHDYPPVYPGFIATYREIWRTYRAQRQNPGAFVDRSAFIPVDKERGGGTMDLPSDQSLASPPSIERVERRDGWTVVARSADLPPNDVIRVDLGEATFSVYRLGDGSLFATDGLCTHGGVHLCDGLVIGTQIECPKHNGRFDIRTGAPESRPVKTALGTYDVREQDDSIELRVMPRSSDGPSTGRASAPVA
jgi:Na+-transporting NADH:ubiquinone oxidoreductase subunit F